MELLYLVGTIWTLLFLTFAMEFDTRRPLSTRLRYKYRINENSIFRKIIKFKDKEHYPCSYFKIVPIYVFLLLAFLSLLLLLVDMFTQGFITDIVPKEVYTIITLSILVIAIVYFVVVTIWWEFVDYKEFKSTESEKEKLKELKKKNKD